MTSLGLRWARLRFPLFCKWILIGKDQLGAVAGQAQISSLSQGDPYEQVGALTGQAQISSLSQLNPY